MINSRLGRFACGRGPPGARPSPPAAPLLPKLRGHCAEFLNHGSPDRLGMLYPPTCVGFGTGARSLPRGFSREHGLDGFARRLRLASRAPCRADFHALRPTRFHGDVQNPARLPSSVAPSVITVPRRCRNVRLLRIGYACRPRLSSRLTLGGLAFPRNPWAHGGSVSHAALATHASILTSERSTAGRPAASPPSESSPTTNSISPPLRRHA